MSITFNSDHCIRNCLENHKPCMAASSRHRKHPAPPAYELKKARHPKAPQDPPPIDIAFVSSRVAAISVTRGEEVCLTSMEEVERLCNMTNQEWADTQLLRMAGAKVLPEDFEKFRDRMERPHMSKEEILAKLPEVLHPLYHGFDPREADEIPPQRGKLDHAIEIQLDPETGKLPRPSSQRLRPLSRDEARAVKLYIDDMIRKGHIERSTSEWAAPLLVVKKPGGGIRICVDYRGLNAHTIKNRNTPPLIRDMLTKLSKAKFFSKVDVIAAFNKIRIKEEHKHLSAFITPYGLYQYTVMPFGMCNSPGTFQAYINDVLHEYLDEFCMAYLDDVIIFSETREEHDDHLLRVVTRLSNAGLPMDILKSEFLQEEVKFLGLIITPNGIKMDPEKVSAIQDWLLPKTLKDVQAFLGFANFYRRFIYGFSDIAKPLTHLTRGDPKLFQMTPEASRAFDQLKQAFCSEVVLAHFNPDLKCILETDASDYVYAAVLSQIQSDDTIRPVAYLSKKMTPTECNYEIYDKELLAIVRAFEEWRPELAGAADTVEVLTDHRGLEYFRSKRHLNRRQARWAEFLEEFDFKVKYRPGKQGTKPDSLTRRTGDLPESVTDDRIQHQCQTILGDHRWDGGSHEAVRLAGLCLGEAECDLPSILSLMHESGEGMSRVGTAMVRLARLTLQGQHDPYDDLEAADEMTTQGVIDALYPTDARLTAIRDALNNGHRRIPHHLIAEGVRLELGDLETNAEGKLFMRYNRLLVPFSEKLRTRIIKDTHDSLPGGHGGRTTTYQQVSQWYYWQGMTDTIARFTNNCTTCRRSKVNRHAKHGLLHPLPVPEKYWVDISIDFITPLPPSKWCGHSYRHIMVVVDRLSKKKKFIAMENMEVPTVVDKFLEYIWREEGYPKTLVSDRGRQFTSHFWRRLCDRVGTSPKLSTAHHPETDGQTENANADLKQYLRSYVNYLQDDWAQLLPLAEFEANSAISSATGVSPFQATKGYQPRSGLEPAHAITNATPAAAQQRAADSLTNRIDATRRYLRDEIAWTQERMKDFADVHRHPAPRFAVGDWVLLNAKHIKTERPVKSLDHKNMGPYQITRVIDNMAYELDLPESLKNIFPAFHPWLLQPYEDDALPGQPRANDHAPPEVHLNDEGDTEYVIAQVLDSRIRNTMNDPHTGRRGCLQYKVEWVGDDQSKCWQPYFNLRGSKESVQDFHDRNPGRPGPHATFHDYDENGQLAIALLCVFDRSLNAQSGL
ncbi:RNA-directed DNA polymerase [Pyrenophora teres f. teres]|uniref:RNA-directed DNA polymerase n=7 Tax=Pyrenophora teres f. teres TaxID=97479 RepID=A0A6S6WGR7_9PLEO|nr:RNA-directed DNA polymerase [Pyrenophora teres f. teres]